MILEDGLYAWASGITEIAALIGEPDGLRFTKLVVRQKSPYPASVMQRTGTLRDETACGPIRLCNATVQLDHYAKSWDKSVQLAEVFRTSLQDFQRRLLELNLAAGMMGAVPVKSVTLQNEFDLDDPEPGLYRRSQSWRFWYVES